MAIIARLSIVWGFGAIQKFTVEGEGAPFTRMEDTNPEVALGSGRGREAVLPASELASLELDGEGRLLPEDPKNSVVYEISIP